MHAQEILALLEPVGLPQSLANGDRAGDGHVERAQARAHRDHQLCIGRPVNLVGHAGGFAPEHQDIVRVEAMREVGRIAVGGEQDEAQTRGPTPILETLPRGMPGERDPIEIVHAGAAEGPVGGRKAGRLDDMGVEPKAGREPQNGPGVLWNIRLEQGDTHGSALSDPPPWAAPAGPAPMAEITAVRQFCRGHSVTR